MQIVGSSQAQQAHLEEESSVQKPEPAEAAAQPLAAAEDAQRPAVRRVAVYSSYRRSRVSVVAKYLLCCDLYFIE